MPLRHDLLTHYPTQSDQARLDDLLQRHPEAAQPFDNALTTVDLSPVTTPA